MARVLIAAGAPVEGDAADNETPLITAASYGDVEVVRVLLESGANLDAVAAAGAGGVPGGTALRHAAVFEMTGVAELLLAAGARDLVQAAAAGDIHGLLTADTPECDRVAALRIAARHAHVEIIDQLLAASTPVDGVDADGSTALHEAAYRGQAKSVRSLLTRGADPSRSDTRFHSTPLGWARHQRDATGPGHGHDEVEQILAPITPDQP